MNAVLDQFHRDGVVETRRRGDDGRVDPRNQLAEVGRFADLVFRGDRAPRFGDRIGDADELDAFEARQQSSMDASQMSGANHANSHGLQAALLRSRARPCLPSC